VSEGRDVAGEGQLGVESAGAFAQTPRRPARAEVIGSLLRPPRLLEAMEELYAPGHLMAYADDRARDHSRADAIADEEIRRVVARQIDAGLDVVTDGEFRRLLYTNSLQDAIEGFEPGEKGRTFRAPTGEVFDTAPLPVAAARLRKVGSPAAREATFLSAITEHPFKVTLPAGSWFLAPENYVAGITDLVYSSPAELFEDVLAILRELIGDAIAAGARYVQLDFPRYVHLIDEAPRQALRAAGVDLDDFLERALDADRRVIEGFPDDVTFGLHVCRGNFRSAWLFNGSLEPLAERIFNELPYDVFLVEWEDTEREGDYSPLRHVPAGPTVALGAVSSKFGRLESEDAVVGALEEASRYLDISQLAISTQCGFASEAQGNRLSEEEQWRKLDLIGAVAARVWG
jgi:5-methyltetrahydropteroyltriglutamate--homocysteine methyltransferase